MKKILIANRGEIALRIMRTAKKLGIQTVAVFSEVDRNAPHVKFADEAICIGPPASSESYLVMDKIINAAKDTHADGIHPGYGFLSENAVFAQLVTDANITFIGPKPHAIQVMGNKLAAKETVKDYDIPMVPGIDEAITSIALAQQISDEIGYPILIKAAAGGGGKGMRIVEKKSQLKEQMERAISEAVAAFGDGSVFIEKYVGSPRHIEVQVLADTHGNVVHLFERECSVQRRHQKVIEEAPSAVLDDSLRKAMGEAAIKVAKSCNYIGAGTVEFLLDENKNFYFLEMNTRLQVEHPVTEMITGIDLVEEQINVAMGKPLSFTQDDLQIKGHALEVRVYAEDPMDSFLPSIGTLTTYKRPVGEGIRLDDGFEEGMQVPIYYDPMIAKLVTYGATRNEAIERMVTAIDDYHIEGIATTLAFGKFVCRHDAFISGDFDTHFVKKYWSKEAYDKLHEAEEQIAAEMGLKLYLEQLSKLKVPVTPVSNWKVNRN